jgi:cobalt-zinc-cadmium efflux system membrane fusion protein
MELPSDEFTAPGKVEFNPNRVSRVLLPAAGRIVDVLAYFGDAVRKDDPLLTLESPDADEAAASYLQANASLTAAQAERTKAEQDLERARDLFAGDAIARKEVLAAETSFQQARTAVDTAQAARTQAEARLQLLGLRAGDPRPRITLRAPLSGKVTEFNVVAGEYRNDTSQPLMTIADLSTVWMAADVPESAIRMVSLNEQFEVSLNAFPGERFRSRVARIADSVDPENRTIKVWAELLNTGGRFRPEMFGQVRHLEEPHTVPVVPVECVVQMEGRTAVYIQEAPGQFRVMVVRTGKRAGDVVPILDGVKVGDRVVRDGAMLLRGF